MKFLFSCASLWQRRIVELVARRGTTMNVNSFPFRTKWLKPKEWKQSQETMQTAEALVTNDGLA